MWEPFFGQEVERQGDPCGQADAIGAPAQFAHKGVRVGIRGRGEQLAGHPENALCLVRNHHFVNLGLEIGEHFDSSQRFCVRVQRHVAWKRDGPPVSRGNYMLR